MPGTVSDLKPKNLVALMAEKFNLSPDEFKRTIKKTCGLQNASDEEFITFIAIAHQHGFDPFTREIYAFQRPGGGLQFIVGYDGWLRKMNEHPAYDGVRYHDEVLPDGSLTSVTCRIYRKDRKHPIEVTEYMKECRRSTDPWRQWPNRMLRIKATNQGIRLAFGLAGLMDPDEAERYFDSLKEQQKALAAAGSTAIDNVTEDIPEEEPARTVKLTLKPEPAPEPEKPEPEPPKDEYIELDQQQMLENLVTGNGWRPREVDAVIREHAGCAVEEIRVSQLEGVAVKIQDAAKARKPKDKPKK